jgi:hypothetical protein
MPAGRSSNRPPLAGLLAGFVGCVLMYALSKIAKVAELEPGRYSQLGIALVICLAIGYAVGASARRHGGRNTARHAATGFGAALIGIAAAVFFWARLEDLVLSRFGEPIYKQRFLFPIDVAIIWFYGALPIIGGILLGASAAVTRTPPSPSASSRR